MTTAENPNSMANLAGKFIVLDGTEGSGKSTQTQLLRDRLIAAGLDVLQVRDPGTTRIGEQIRAILLNPDNAEMGMRAEMLLYMAARAQMITEVVIPAIETGKLVLSDRFVSSTLAYQLGGEDLNADEIRDVAQIAIQGHWPDMTLILDMPAEKSIARVQREKDRIEQRPLEYHEMVRQNFHAQAKLEPDAFRIIDADRDVQVVHGEIWAALQSLS
jgi:dTMP kinase